MGPQWRSLTKVSVLLSGMRWRNLIPSLILGLLFHGTAYSQTSVDLLRGTSDAAQGVFDRQIAPATTQGSTPDFPGGLLRMYDFIRANLVYPPAELAAGVHGRVDVEFVVKTDGTLDKVQVKTGLDPAMDKEALRVVNAMPKWIPGQKDGKPIDMRMIIPIMFELPAATAPAKD